MSPSLSKRGNGPEDFSAIAVPMLLMTGTDDQHFGSKESPETRRGVFKGLTPLAVTSSTRHYELVFEGANHGAFSDRELSHASNKIPHHHPAIQEISLKFWDSALLEDKEASDWLNGEAPRSVLKSQDLWQKK